MWRIAADWSADAGVLARTTSANALAAARKASYLGNCSGVGAWYLKVCSILSMFFLHLARHEGAEFSLGVSGRHDLTSLNVLHPSFSGPARVGNFARGDFVLISESPPVGRVRSVFPY